MTSKISQAGPRLRHDRATPVGTNVWILRWGSGASKGGGAGLSSVLLGAVVGMLAFTAAPALASASPTVTIKPVGTVTSTTAKVSGTVNPNGGPMTVWNFQYSKDPETEGWTPSTVAGPAFANEEVKGTLEELQPNATYQVRLVATNEEGGEGVSAEPNPKFTTKLAPPAIESESVANVKSSEATFEGTVNPNNQVTECHFQYGMTKVSESEVSCSPELLKGYGGQGVGPKNGEGTPVPTGGLTPGAAYKYRIVTKNGKSEEGIGTERTFNTAEPPEVKSASPLTATTAKLNGVLNPHNAFEAGSYEFLYKQSEGECTGGGKAPTPAAAAAGSSPEPESAEVMGLQPGATYTYCLLLRNAAGEEAALSSPETFTTHAAVPTVSVEQVTSVEETSVALKAAIDPDGLKTKYEFEYDTRAYAEGEAPHGTLVAGTPSSPLPVGVSPVAVEGQLTGLTPGATYYYRVVAANGLGATNGEGKTFTTNSAPGSPSAENCPNEQLRAEQPFGLTLPDCRAYEMVSPVETEGQDATDSFVSVGPRAAVSGEAVTYSSKGAFADPAGETEENQFLSRRGPGGWSTQPITPPQEPVASGGDVSYEATVFTPDLEEGIANTNAPLVKGAPGGKQEDENGLYLTNFAEGLYRYVAPATSPMGASTDLSHVVFGEGGEVSEWVEGQVFRVNLTNSGTSMSASVGSAARASGVSRRKDVWNAVSSSPGAEGTRVYFTSPYSEEESDRQLYLRVNPEQQQDCTIPTDACTVEVSASRRAAADTNGPRSARFWGASENGEKVFFTSSAELTEDAYTGPTDDAENLYECELEFKARTGCKLTDLTGDATDSTGEGAAVQGVVQVSDSGSYVYFAAKGALKGKGGATLRNRMGEAPIAERDNLYVSYEGGTPTFIATLEANDKSDWGYGLAYPEAETGPAINSAVTTPTGSQLAFMSERRLTGYDNLQSHTGECEGSIGRSAEVETGHCREIYLYRASADPAAEPGRLVCASCNPTGARPAGSASLSQPAYAVAQYRPRNLLEDGTLFFNSSDALVPQASDGRQNVYEYEDGQIHAISDVAGGYESFFLDASNEPGEEGANVFFATADDLLRQDTSGNVVVWDARVGGGFPVTATAPSCEDAASCKPPESPQPAIFGAPPSATFSGPGDSSPAPTATVTPKKKTADEIKAEKLAKALQQCRGQKSKQKRASCEKSARKKYAPVKPKKAKKSATTNRRAPR